MELNSGGLVLSNIWVIYETYLSREEEIRRRKCKEDYEGTKSSRGGWNDRRGEAELELLIERNLILEEILNEIL